MALGRERPPAGGDELNRLHCARAPPAEDGRGWAGSWREASEWPDTAKPVTKKIEYDDLYRVRRMDYLYSTSSGTDTWQSPFSKENTDNPNATNPPPDQRRARPVPHLSFASRPMWQRFEYDWLGNLAESDDDAHGGWDRSLGVQQHTNTGKPYQLKTATNSSLVGSTGTTATVTTKYDNAGNLTRLGVVRPSGRCVSMHNGTAMASPSCSQFYAYDYDEVGRLSRARRWDSSAQSFNPDTFDVNTTASIELRYRYDANDQRVIKRVYSSTASSQRHTLCIFGSLEVHRTAYANNAYTINADTTVPYAMANGVRLARLHYSNVSPPAPAIGGTGVSALDYKTNTAPELHVLLELGDHLGSTGTVLDKLSGELVEKTAYLPFGAREADYRPSRWSGFREDYGFTGKEEDVEVGLTYFGKRYLSAQLGRWVSPDPLAVHAAGKADFNLYAYVSGAVLKNVDPIGLDAYSDWDAGTSANEQEAAKGSESPGVSGTPNAGSQFFGNGQVPQVATPDRAKPQSAPATQAGKSDADNILSAIKSSASDFAAGFGEGGRTVWASHRLDIPGNSEMLLDLQRSESPSASYELGRLTGVAVNEYAHANAEYHGVSIGSNGATGRFSGTLNPASGQSSAARGETTAIVKWDGDFATKQLLGSSTTPGGKQINFHAADRMVNPPKGRVPMSAAEVDDFVDTANAIKKIQITDEGTSVTLLNSRYPKAQIAVDGNRVITVINPKVK